MTGLKKLEEDVSHFIAVASLSIWKVNCFSSKPSFSVHVIILRSEPAPFVIDLSFYFP